MIRRPPRSTLFPLHDALPIFEYQVPWIHDVIGEAEALAVKPEIKSIADLKGKKVATPLASTSHYSLDRKSTRLNSSHANISYAVFCLKKKKGSPYAAPAHPHY